MEGAGGRSYVDNSHRLEKATRTWECSDHDVLIDTCCGRGSGGKREEEEGGDAREGLHFCLGLKISDFDWEKVETLGC